MIQAAIPSPTVSVIRLGALSIHLYALCIVAGILVALWLTDRRWRARGGGRHQVGDVAGWAVLFGIVGGRLYHVITDPELYFGSGKHPLDAVKIWDGGLGIWGAIALGALGAWIGCRRHQMDFGAFADSAAPGVLLAQAIGRWGNWFNNELYGRATSLPWKLQIHEVDVVSGKAARDSAGKAIVLGYYHPTFLYEMLWSLAVVALLLWADHRRLLGRWQVLALYVMGYTFGRFFIEALRSDEANRILGMRVNSWMSILVFLAALAWFLRLRGNPRSVAGPGDSGDDVLDGSAGHPAAPAAEDRPVERATGSVADSADRPADATENSTGPVTDSAGPAENSANPADRQSAGGAGSHATDSPAIDSDHVQQRSEGRSEAPTGSRGAAHGPAGDPAPSDR
ncbi:prolipoprotein diacylglyceryl transferase [Jatrophihabitans sp.]|uniref:prolipoprotein diacylglyceryl transferase n=1 Tax=Jatrophihabitans sp. TaxID=1932789 RepID=UPI002F0E9F00